MVVRTSTPRRSSTPFTRTPPSSRPRSSAAPSGHGRGARRVRRPAGGATLDEDELVAFLTQRIAKFKLPTSVTFVDEVPKNPVGKFDKPRLRATIASAGASAMSPGEETS
ncbi:hypothetical protein ACFQV4_01500 [Streptomyces thermocarboxydus]